MSTTKVRHSAAMPAAENLSGSHEAAFTARDLLLYVITVFSWSASWYALKVNSGFAVAPPVSTCWRFLLASVLMFLIVALSKGPLRFGRRAHVAFALMGVFLFSTNFKLIMTVSNVMAALVCISKRSSSVRRKGNKRYV